MTVPIDIQENDLEMIVEEYNNTDEDSFTHKFFESLLQKAAEVTKKITNDAIAMNMINPFGIILPLQKQSLEAKER